MVACFLLAEGGGACLTEGFLHTKSLLRTLVLARSGRRGRGEHPMADREDTPEHTKRNERFHGATSDPCRGSE